MKKYLLAVGLGLSPLVALANNTTYTQTSIATGNLNASIINITNTVNLLVPLMLAVAVVFFIYGVIKFIIAKGGGEKEAARNLIIWTVIGLASVLAIWGLARLLIDFFGLRPTNLDNSLLPTITPATLPTIVNAGN